MLHLEGDTDFSQTPALVWEKLSDLDFVLDCIPDLEKVTHQEPAKAVCLLRPGLAFVRGILEVTLRIIGAESARSLRVHAHGKGIGSSNDVELNLAFLDHAGSTRIHWTADVTNLGGLLKALPQGLLEGAAKKVIADVWGRVKKKLG